MKELWTIEELYNDGNEQAALVYLYETLIDNHTSPELCDEFLRDGIMHIVFKDSIMNSDVIVHTRNALRSIKDQLTMWEIFTEFSYGFLVKECGEEKAKILIEV